MDRIVLHQIKNHLTQRVWIQRAALICLSITCFFLGLQSITNKTTVTIIPWTLQYTSRISENNADASYQIAWGLALAMMLGNCNYGIVDTIEPRIRPLLPPRSADATIKALRQQAEQFKESKITVRYEIESYTAEKDKVFVEGSYYIKAPGVAERKHTRTYEFIIAMENYQPQIKWLTTYEDHAHTEAYLKESRRLREADAKRQAELMGEEDAKDGD